MGLPKTTTMRNLLAKDYCRENLYPNTLCHCGAIPADSYLLTPVPQITPPTTYPNWLHSDQICERLLYKFMANYDRSRRTVGGLPPPPLLPYHRPPPDRDLSDDGAQSQLPLRIWIVPAAYWGWKFLRTDCRPGPTLSNTPKF
jgi:hypothetical protein